MFTCTFTKNKENFWGMFFFFSKYPDFSLSPTIPSRPTGTDEEGSGGQTETMLNPLWPELELVMAGTLAEVPLPPYHEARLLHHALPTPISFEFDIKSGGNKCLTKIRSVWLEDYNDHLKHNIFPQISGQEYLHLQ